MSGQTKSSCESELAEFMQKHREYMAPLKRSRMYRAYVSSLTASEAKPRNVDVSDAVTVSHTLESKRDGRSMRSTGAWSRMGEPYTPIGAPDNGDLLQKHLPKQHRVEIAREAAEKTAQHPLLAGGMYGVAESVPATRGEASSTGGGSGTDQAPAGNKKRQNSEHEHGGSGAAARGIREAHSRTRAEQNLRGERRMFEAVKKEVHEQTGIASEENGCAPDGDAALTEAQCCQHTKSFSQMLRLTSKEQQQDTFPRAELNAASKRRIMSKGGTAFVDQDAASKSAVSSHVLCASLFPSKTRFEQAYEGDARTKTVIGFSNHAEAAGIAPEKSCANGGNAVTPEHSEGDHMHINVEAGTKGTSEGAGTLSKVETTPVSTRSASQAHTGAIMPPRHSKNAQSSAREDAPAPRNLLEMHKRTSSAASSDVAFARMNFMEARYRQNRKLMDQLERRTNGMLRARSSTSGAKAVAHEVEAFVASANGQPNTRSAARRAPEDLYKRAVRARSSSRIAASPKSAPTPLPRSVQLVAKQSERQIQRRTPKNAAAGNEGLIHSPQQHHSSGRPLAVYADKVVKQIRDFYKRLCQLAESTGVVSNTAAVACVSAVKAALESGTGISYQLLEATMDVLANKQLSKADLVEVEPLISFMRAECAVTQQQLRSILERHGMHSLRQLLLQSSAAPDERSRRVQESASAAELMQSQPPGIATTAGAVSPT